MSYSRHCRTQNRSLPTCCPSSWLRALRTKGQGPNGCRATKQICLQHIFVIPAIPRQRKRETHLFQSPLKQTEEIQRPEQIPLLRDGSFLHLFGPHKGAKGFLLFPVTGLQPESSSSNRRRSRAGLDLVPPANPLP